MGKWMYFLSFVTIKSVKHLNSKPLRRVLSALAAFSVFMTSMPVSVYALDYANATPVAGGITGNTVGNATTMQNGLSSAEMETVQTFNHLRRAMQTVFNLPVEDGEVYLEARVKTDNSLDDADRGGMNRIFSTISYSGTNRPFYMRYMPYYVMSMRAPCGDCDSQ